MSQFVAAVRGTEKDLGVPDSERILTVFMDISWHVYTAYASARRLLTATQATRRRTR